MRRCIYKKIHYLTFDLDLGVNVARNVTQYPLHHVIYAPTKFEVATSKGLGEDTIARNVTDGRTEGRRTAFGTKLIYHTFLTRKRVCSQKTSCQSCLTTSFLATGGFKL